MVFGVSQSTISRMVNDLEEPIAAVLDCEVPELEDMITGRVVVLDGTLIPTRNRAAHRELYSSQHHESGAVVQILSNTEGRLRHVGEPIAGSIHDVTAYRETGLAAVLAEHMNEGNFVITSIVDPMLPRTFLQQRLGYVEANPGRRWTLIHENVPVWPSGVVPLVTPRVFCLGQYESCDGLPSLRRAVAAMQAKKYDVEIDERSVLITNGGLNALALVFQLLSNRGSYAIYQNTSFVSVVDSLQLYGFRTASIPPEPFAVGEMVERADAPVSLIYINSPHNPTGEVIEKATLVALMDEVRRIPAALVLDAVYDDFVFDDKRVCWPDLNGRITDDIFLVGSMSKNFGAPGLRIGWVVASPWNITRLGGMLETNCVAVSGLAQELAVELIRTGNSALCGIVNKGRQAVVDMLARVDDLSVVKPEGGTQVVARLPVEDIENFADFALTKHGLMLTTSSSYATKEAFVRVPTGANLEIMRRAIDLLRAGLQEFLSTGISVTSAHGICLRE